MNPTVLTALISGLCVAIPTIISVIVTSNTRDAITEERIKNLSKQIDDLSVKVDTHNRFGERIALLESVLDLYHVGYGDDTLKEVLKRFYQWLEDNTEWEEVSPQTYWEPAEYRCVGISGYTFDPNEFWHPAHRKFFYLKYN